ncbi:hypothetical protein AAFF_G00328180, partial [Aldrovandia affinis]
KQDKESFPKEVITFKKVGKEVLEIKEIVPKEEIALTKVKNAMTQRMERISTEGEMGLSKDLVYVTKDYRSEDDLLGKDVSSVSRDKSFKKEIIQRKFSLKQDEESFQKEAKSVKEVSLEKEHHSKEVITFKKEGIEVLEMKEMVPTVQDLALKEFTTAGTQRMEKISPVEDRSLSEELSYETKDYRSEDDSLGKDVSSVSRDTSFKKEIIQRKFSLKQDEESFQKEAKSVKEVSLEKEHHPKEVITLKKEGQEVLEIKEMVPTVEETALPKVTTAMTQKMERIFPIEEMGLSKVLSHEIKDYRSEGVLCEQDVSSVSRDISFKKEIPPNKFSLKQDDVPLQKDTKSVTDVSFKKEHHPERVTTFKKEENKVIAIKEMVPTVQDLALKEFTTAGTQRMEKISPVEDRSLSEELSYETKDYRSKDDSLGKDVSSVSRDTSFKKEIIQRKFSLKQDEESFQKEAKSVKEVSLKKEHHPKEVITLKKEGQEVLEIKEIVPTVEEIALTKVTTAKTQKMERIFPVEEMGLSKELSHEIKDFRSEGVLCEQDVSSVSKDISFKKDIPP